MINGSSTSQLRKYYLIFPKRHCPKGKIPSHREFLLEVSELADLILELVYFLTLKILNERNAMLYTMPGPCTGPLVYPGVLNQLPCFPAPSAAFKFSGDLLWFPRGTSKNPQHLLHADVWGGLPVLDQMPTEVVLWVSFSHKGGKNHKPWDIFSCFNPRLWQSSINT